MGEVVIRDVVTSPLMVHAMRRAPVGCPPLAATGQVSSPIGAIAVDPVSWLHQSEKTPVRSMGACGVIVQVRPLETVHSGFEELAQ